ncbi:hypothetical protein PC116_g21091 [Phytophthora cactorum]|uniref:Uncharacterized protein n=1 Tax=Phytophthora cactorum TaxID=29920 RepID=A0A8T1BSC3_9STRA|nr:hypothetical protein Pcac1_g761 [Phytophthora cactorum]KAG2806020.1 hypothetical protein PC111_g17563 [Phytophthora cactorum]KAG2808232.1 hypothetical protein PC112_g17049 [Phytophthora cactorum]KAG2843809.1 hypothetical protein PC113_g18524 [Phytophthora cactorum]KAG2908925.1 hypothetical protein PC117_g19824 [Phytophthora cactorum]
MECSTAEQVGMATLEETLAFLDFFDWDNNCFSSTTSSIATGSSSTSVSSASDVKHDAPHDGSAWAIHSTTKLSHGDPATKQRSKKAQGKSKRKRCTLSSSTRLQQRKKAELLYLRKRVQEMEEYVEQLKACPMNTRLMEHVKAQYHARLQSEEVNRTLRAILANQVHVSGSLREILQKQASIQPLVFRRDFMAVGNESLMMDELQRKASRLYLDSDSVFEPTKSPLLSSSTHIRLDSNRNKTIDIFTCTPLLCSMDTAKKLVLKELQNQRQYPDKWYQTAPGKQSNVTEKKYVFLVRNTATTLKVSGLQVACRFHEPNRSVYTGADVMILTTTGLRLTLHTWIVITPSEIDPLNSSVVRMCFRLSVACKEDFSAYFASIRNTSNIG